MELVVSARDVAESTVLIDETAVGESQGEIARDTGADSGGGSSSCGRGTSGGTLRLPIADLGYFGGLGLTVRDLSHGGRSLDLAVRDLGGHGSLRLAIANLRNFGGLRLTVGNLGYFRSLGLAIRDLGSHRSLGLSI